MRIFRPRAGTTRRTLGALAIGALALTAVGVTGQLTTHHTGAGTVADSTAQIDPASCTTGLTPKPGFDLDLCLAGHGQTITPAIIVHQVGVISSACQITLGVFDDANNRLDDPSRAASLPCTNGEHDGTPLDVSQLTGITVNTAPDGSITVHASADLTIDGQESNLGASPTYTYLPTSITPPTSGPTGASASASASGPVSSPEPSTTAPVLYQMNIPLTYGDTTSWQVKSTVANVFEELHRCFNCNFPVPGAPATYPAYGQLLNLWDAGGHVHAPVRAYPHDSDGYLLYVAQPGHFDGAGSTVQFNFYNDSAGYTHLVVTARTVNNTILQLFSKAGASVRWHQFARQLGTNLVTYNEGTKVLIFQPQG